MGISIGLVGLGQFGSAFASLFKSHPAVSRIGLCDMEPDRVRRFAENPFFADKFDPRDAYTALEDICAALRRPPGVNSHANLVIRGGVECV